MYSPDNSFEPDDDEVIVTNPYAEAVVPEVVMQSNQAPSVPSLPLAGEPTFPPGPINSLQQPVVMPYPPPSFIPEPQMPERVNRKLLLLTISMLLISVVVFATGVTVFINARQRVQSQPMLQPSAAATTAAAPSATSSVPVAFQQAPCPFTPGRGMKEGSNMRCGLLTVPEDHSIARGTSIQLAVAIFKSPVADTSATPVIYLDGGPGGATLSLIGPQITATNRQIVTLGHDMIFFDQRGAGYSRPSLSCPELERVESYQSQVIAIRNCHDRLIRSGINLSAYTTLQNAADVHDLIHALGYRQANLYGISYGTRLALTVMRLFPADVRSVVLDSTVPLQYNLFTSWASVTQHAFDTFFKGCSSSASCHEKYPQLENVFYRLVEQWNNRPVSIALPGQGDTPMSGDGLASWLFLALYDTRNIPELPKVIMQINNGDYARFAQMYQQEEDYRISRQPVIHIPGYAGAGEQKAGISAGLYYSVGCGEDMAFASQAQLEASVQALRPELQDGIRDELLNELAICQIWQQPAVPAQQKQPVVSSLPTLVLAGEFDPTTPPDNGRLAARTLSKSYFFLFPGTGHGVYLTHVCPYRITIAFLTQPDYQPGSSCINTMHEPEFQ